MELTANQRLSFESLRGISAIIVMIAHAYQNYFLKYYPQYEYFSAVTAQSCVMIFFVMSGFLVRSSIENNILVNGKFSLSSYAKSRATRIFPPLLFCIALCFILYYIAFALSSNYFLPQDFWATRGRMLATDSRWVISLVTFTNGFIVQNKLFNAPLWSLPFEVWFYVIAGLVCHRKLLCVFVAVIIILSMMMIRIDFLYYLIVWMTGYALCAFRDIFYKHKYITHILMAASFAVMIYTLDIYLSKVVEISVFNLSFGVFSAFFIFVVLIILNVKFAVWTSSSKYSYTLYLIHYPLMIFTYGALSQHIPKDVKGSIMLSVTSMIASLLIAKYSAEIFENKKRLKKLI